MEEKLRESNPTRVLLGLFFGILTIFTLVTLVSYMFTWADDQSLLAEGKALLGDSELFARNGGGKIGYLYANFLVTRLFGFGAFVLPFLFLAVTIYCLRLRKINIWSLVLVTVYGAVSCSLLCSFIFSFTSFANMFGSGAGGAYGEVAVKWLVSMIGRTGTGCVIAFLFFGWLVMLNPKIARLASSPCAIPAQKEENVEKPSRRELRRRRKKENENRNREEEEDKTAGNEDEKPSPVEPASKSGEDGVDFVVNNGEEAFLAGMSEDEKTRLFDPTKTLSRYKNPPLSLLNDYKDKWYEVSSEELQNNKSKIVNALANYKIEVKKISADVGPTVTLYKIIPREGTRIRQIRSLDEDLAMSLGAKGVRVVTLEDSVGIEVANAMSSIVALKAVLGSQKFRDASKKMELPIALGLTVTKEPFFFDLAKMPHLLVAGATGMGKSVGLNSIITSIIYTKHPSEVKFVMVDPKKVELAQYNRIENDFLAKMPDSDQAIITDVDNVVRTLKSLCVEMDARYDLLMDAGVRKISEYNEKFLRRKLNPQKGHRYMPYIIVIVDEFADLLMTAGREVEEPICRLAQKARAIGIHLVIATQRPTTDIITGTIKANFNSRIAFRVMSSVDSKTIIDQSGANRLIGRGDMLIMGTGIELTRVQCAFIDTDEIDRVTDYISKQQQYSEPYLLPEYVDENDNSGGLGTTDLRKRDELFADAAKLVVMNQQGSTSLIQRKMMLGYNRAGRIMDQLEAAGIVGPMQGSKARQVLVTDLDSLDRILQNLN
ncbi:MAG: DNA translocase FtsK [Bacteroidales bacterium]|nr:DNA translocase FtsK [Bacteroidales bacterium]MCI2121471.1 DNA translocase FtsK [Bacteroidales bacterium]MCI2145268.1 DNA translocase FtsK [Bacteroidales bacterium]